MMIVGIILLIIAAFVYAIGLTIADIEDIRRARDIRRHPFTSRRRARPPIAVHMRGNSTHATLQHVGYRKLVFASTVSCDYILDLDSRVQLSHGVLHDAMFILQRSPHLAGVAISYVTSSPTSLLDLLVHYREYIGVLSDKSRRGLALPPRSHAHARLIRVRPSASWIGRSWEFAYSIAAQIATLFLSYILVYSLYIAISVHQTTLFVVFAVSFLTFVSYAIFSTQQLSLTDKCLYLLLLPVGVPYLVLQPWWRCMNLAGRLIHAWYQRSRLARRTISGA